MYKENNNKKQTSTWKQLKIRLNDLKYLLEKFVVKVFLISQS